MSILEKGCFCCDLQTCVKVHSFLLTGGFSVLATVNTFVLVRVTLRESENTSEENGWYIRYTKGILIGVLVFLLLWVLVGLLLMCGVYKRKRHLFWPYMIAASINSAVFLGLLLYYAAIVQNTQTYIVAIIALILAFQFYCLLHVVSLYQKFGTETYHSHSHESDQDLEKQPVTLTACRRTLGCLPSPPSSHPSL